MTLSAYYNEIDGYACDWLQNLMDAGHITPGRIDDRSIADVSPDDLRGFDRVHLFAGIAGWDMALNLAGWGDRQIWTGSCPCQPFSNAGKRRGSDDERHLWPAFHRLVAECRPPVVAGEQVASKVGRTWLAAVRTDLEGLGYAVGAADLCAAGVGAPHIRQRLWWVADAHNGSQGLEPGGSRSLCKERKPERSWSGPRGSGADDGLGDANQPGSQGRILDAGEHADQLSPWASSVFIPCSDGKARPTQPGLFPLAHGVPGRVGQLRAYGNAIVPQIAAEFVRSCMEAVA